MSETLPDLLARRAALSGNAPAIADDRMRLDYAGLDRAAGIAAAALSGAGLAAGERLAILCRNRVDFFVLLFACARIGAILVPLNWRLAPTELAAILADADPALLLADAANLVAAEAAAPAGLPILSLDDPAGWRARLAAAPAAAPPRLWPSADPWLLLYTSGTTGRPKGVIQTYGNAFANHVTVRDAVGISAESACLSALPHFHTAGINLYALPTLLAGGRVRLLAEFDAGTVLALLPEATHLFAVPTIYRLLEAHPAFAAADLASVAWGCGGSRLEADLITRWAARGALVRGGMGMTETGPMALLMERAGVAAKPGSAGRPQFLVEARAVADGATGTDAAPGTVGEIWFRGPAVTPGYWRQPEATAAAFAPGGWLRSGDLATVDADGDFQIVGRAKDMFVSGGENVYAGEVEAVLLDHPAIREAAVKGRPDPRWCEVGHAWLVVQDDIAPPHHAEIAAFCRARLAAYKVPRGFTVVPALPRTETGKVRKHLLA